MKTKALAALLLSAGLLQASPATDLLLGAQKGQMPRVKEALEKGAPIDTADARGETALIKAAKLGKATMVKLLVEKGADPSWRDKSGKTARDWAEAGGHALALKFLPGEEKPRVEEKKEPKAPKPRPEPAAEEKRVDASLGQALIEAALSSDLKDAKELLKQGADPNQLMKKKKYKDWEEAAAGVPKDYALEGKEFEGYHLANMESLHAMKNGKFQPATLLNAVIQAGDMKMARLLLEHGADPNFSDKYNQGALGAALDSGRSEILGDIIARGGRISGLGFMGYFDEVNVKKRRLLSGGGIFVGMANLTPKSYSQLAELAKARGGSFEGQSLIPYFGFKINSYFAFSVGLRGGSGSMMMTAEGPSGNTVTSVRAFKTSGMDISILDAEISLVDPWEDWGAWQLYMPLRAGVGYTDMLLTPRYDLGFIKTSLDGVWTAGYAGGGLGLRYCGMQPLVLQLNVNYLISLGGEAKKFSFSDPAVISGDYGGLELRVGAYLLAW